MDDEIVRATTRQRLRAHLTVDQLYAFQMVNRAGSMRAAAKYLAMSQPAISQRIRHLERILSTQLFDRRQGAQSTLTREGQLLAEMAAEVLGNVDAFHEELENLKVEPRSHLRVVSSSDYMVHLAMQGIVSLKKAGRQVDVVLRHAPSLADISEVLHDGGADIGICRAPAPEGLAELGVVHERLALVVPAGHPLTSCRAEDRGALLATVPIATFSKGMRTREHIERWADKEQVSLRVTVESRSLEPLRQAVIHELAVAVLPTYAVKDDIADGSAEIVPMAGLPLQREAVVVGRTGFQGSPASRLFLTALDESLIDLELEPAGFAAA